MCVCPLCKFCYFIGQVFPAKVENQTFPWEVPAQLPVPQDWLPKYAVVRQVEGEERDKLGGKGGGSEKLLRLRRSERERSENKEEGWIGFRQHKWLKMARSCEGLFPIMEWGLFTSWCLLQFYSHLRTPRAALFPFRTDSCTLKLDSQAGRNITIEPKKRSAFTCTTWRMFLGGCVADTARLLFVFVCVCSRVLCQLLKVQFGSVCHQRIWFVCLCRYQRFNLTCAICCAHIHRSVNSLNQMPLWLFLYLML